MLYSRALISTSKEDLSTSNTKSYSLMFRASLIKKMGSTYYSYLPLGTRVLNKIKNLIDKKFEKMGVLEVFNGFGSETFLYSAIKNQINKSDDLPLFLSSLREIERKNNVKSGYGLIFNSVTLKKRMEVLAKNKEEARKCFNDAVMLFKEILESLNLKYQPVQTGEDKAEILIFLNEGDREYFLCDSCNYSASKEFILPYFHKSLLSSDKELKKVHTPDVKTINDLEIFFGLSKGNFIKSVFFDVDGKKILAITAGDRKISEEKLKKIFQTDKVKQEDLRYVERVLALPVGFIGPVNLSHIFIVADYSVRSMKNAITGANEKDYHLINVQAGRDFNVDMIADITEPEGGDICPICRQGKLFKGKGITLADLKITNDKPNIEMKDKSDTPILSLFELDVNRLLAAVVQQNSDERGIVWPLTIAPYEVIVLLVKKNQKNLDKALEFEKVLGKNNVLIDDRNKSMGVKFNDSELLGIPYRIVVSQKAVENNFYEFTTRSNMDKKMLSFEEIVDFIKKGRKS